MVVVGGETVLEVIAVGGELEQLLVAAVAAVLDVTVDQILGGQRLGRLLLLHRPVAARQVLAVAASARPPEIVQSARLNRRRTQSSV